ncbi:hypothetical protein UB46_17520 [Burkholderiaceae bacterium 16]|nr:hypothetical protein UB46_17520 [Burkholderiaceae bacterium 16]
MLAAGINRAHLRRSLADRPLALVAARAPALQDLAYQKLHEFEGVYRIGINALRLNSVEGNWPILKRSGGRERVWHPNAADEFPWSSTAFPHSGR